MTSILCIRRKSGWTELTDGPMLFYETRRVVRAFRRQARVNAFVIDTGQVRGTSIVTQADRHLWTAVFHAHALWLMAQYLTRLILRTLNASTFVLHTGIRAAAVHTRQVRGTFLVGNALPLVWGTDQLAVLIDYEARLANANGPMVASLALLIASANESRCIARIYALAIATAAQQRGTFVVAAARAVVSRIFGSWGALVLAHGIWGALDIGPANKTVGARAARPMQHRLAEGVRPTDTPHGAWVLAMSSDAGLFARAIQIIVAFLV